MINRKLLHALLLSSFALSLTVGIAGCDDSGDDEGSADTGGDGDGDGDGDCSGDDNIYGSDCQEYVDCSVNNCDAAYQSCFGAGYASGDFSGGACADFISCVNACDCNDDACNQACTDMHFSMDSECFACNVNEIGACVATNCQAELAACG